MYNLCLVFWSVVLNRQFSQASLNLSMTFQLSFVACQRLRKISLPQEKRQNRKMKVPSFVKKCPRPLCVSSLFTLWKAASKRSLPKSIKSLVTAVDGEDWSSGISFGHSSISFQNDHLGPNLIVDAFPLVEHLFDMVLLKKTKGLLGCEQM